DRGRDLRAAFVVHRADGRGDRESGRDRQSRVRHLCEPGAFASEQVLHVAIAVGLALTKEEDVLAFPSSHQYQDSIATISEISPSCRTSCSRSFISASRACRSAMSSAMTSTSLKNRATIGSKPAASA